MERADVVVVGGGLAGLSCGLELAEAGREVLLIEARDVVGGRTASWVEDGMPVESGLHRFLGFYVELPRLLRRAGVEPDDILCWEDEIEFCLMAGPIAAAIERRGGRVRTGSPAERLVVQGGRVSGVETGGEEIAARQVVVAMSLGPAQDLLRPAFAGQSWCDPLLRLPSLPSCTIQFELDAPVLPVDRTTFGPQTCLASFSEQCRTTFRSRRAGSPSS